MTSPTSQFHQLLQDEWEARLQANPLFATDTGDHRYNDRLPGNSEADNAHWSEQLKAFRQRQRAIGRADLSPSDQLNYDIFARLLDDEIEAFAFYTYRLPICKMFGIHIYFPQLGQNMPFNTVKDYENYIARLEAFPQYVRDHIEVMRLGLREGQVMPQVALEGVGDSIRTHVVGDPTQSQLYSPFVQYPVAVGEADRQRLSQAGRAAISGAVVPGFVELLNFIAGEYYPAARQSIAAADLPNGREFYRSCIRFYTSLNLTPEEVHRTGMEEVQRIKAEMQAVIQQTGFAGDFQQFIAFLRSDPRFYVETPEALLKENAYVVKKMDGELPRLFKTLPRLPYGVRPIPDFAAPGNTAAYYQPGSGDHTRAGYYYVNTYDLKSRPLYEIEALSLHEAVPGHHLQIALQQELDLPNFRRFNGFTAFVEGWALYAERLGLEVGFYQDAYSNFGRLSYEMWRACRLVVDTGIHALGWSRRQAIDFMLANTSSTLLNITNEVDRYIAWPGQALAYKIGELKIRALRARAEAELGAAFNLREFHDVLLTSGAVPLDVLEKLVNNWIAGVK